ncbi:MAG: response regulator, partial [Planctomycetota bacterium]
LVRIYLPAVKCLKKENPVTRFISPDQLKGNGERILVVEDQKEMLDFVSLALRKNGYTVFGAANAQEALDIFDREKGNIGLVFSDVVLPGQTGIELVDKIISLKPDQKVVLTSGYMDEKSQWPAIQQKGYRFLQKPYPINLLLAAIKENI